MLFIGQIVEIKKAFDAETGMRTREDELTYAEAEILSLNSDGTADVWVKSIGEANISIGRLKKV